MNNQKCKARPEIININSNSPVFYSFSIKAGKCNGNCKNINDLYAKICVSDAVKDFNVKVFNLMLRTNETRHIKWHETCKSRCRLDAIASNNKQRWNSDKSRCECKELIDKDEYHKGYARNSNNCESECDKACDVGEYLDYECKKKIMNCKYKKSLVDNLVDKCDENSDEVKIVSKSKNKCNFCISYIVLFSISFTINVGIGA